MASSYRVTDLEKKSSLNLQSPTPLFSWAFVYFLLVISSFSNLVRCGRFSLFRSVYSSFHNRLDLTREPAFYSVFYFVSQFIRFVCFIICKNEKVLFVLVQ